MLLAPLEGMFALGQVYVLISRVTDPQNLGLIGVPFVVGQSLHHHQQTLLSSPSVFFYIILHGYQMA